MMLYSNAMQKKALEAHGGLYNSDPATSVSSGPFVLKEWRKGDRLIYEANPKYKGTNKPSSRRSSAIGAAPSTDFAAYQAGEIDFVAGAEPVAGRQRDHRRRPDAAKGVPPAATTTSAPTTCSSTPRTRPSTMSRSARRSAM